MTGRWKKKVVHDAMERLNLSVPVTSPRLERSLGPETESVLQDRWVVVGRRERLAREAMEACARAGAGFIVPGEHEFPGYAAELEREGPVQKKREIMAEKADILIFDAGGFGGVDMIDGLFVFLKRWAEKINPSGRILLLATAPEESSPPAYHAVVGSLSGITRALSKEFGTEGITCHLVLVPSGTKGYLGPVVRFLASGRSAFLTGQIWRLSRLEPNEKRFNYVRSLEKRVALVTGGAQGIGAAIARSLAQEGARVILVDRPEANRQLFHTASDLPGTPLVVDITWPKAASFIAGEVKKRHGKLDILVHNAGRYLDCPVASMTPSQWKSVFHVNLESVIRLTESLDPLMRRGGRIIGIASIAGITGIGGHACYSGSKAGLAGYLQALAADLKGREITANAIAAGYIHTALTADLSWLKSMAGRKMSALGQGGIPEDIGNFAAFLASPGATALSGQVIRACGGNLIGA